MRNETDTGVVEAMICHWIAWVSPGRIAVGGDGALERVMLASGRQRLGRLGWRGRSPYGPQQCQQEQSRHGHCCTKRLG